VSERGSGAHGHSAPADRAASPGRPQPWPTAILHLDMDAFFVGVYLLDHPEHRGRPLAVGGSPGGRGVVTSASYEARAFGIRSAMPMRHALRLCPGLTVGRTDWQRIHACSRAVMAVLSRFGPTEPTSVDEACVDLSAAADPAALAPAAREAVVRETGLSASVGLATSRLVAKIASDHGKPGGCVVVRPGDEAAFLAPFPARAIPGIGPRTAERLAALDIQTCADLASTEPSFLALQLGSHAARLPERARGVDRRPVRPERRQPKSISGERTFGRDVADRTLLLQQVAALGGRVSERLRRRGLVARTVFVKFRWSDFTTFTRRRTLAVPVDRDEDVVAVASSLWLAHWPERRKVRLVGVGLADLEPADARQLPLELG
jgi:DNA polymerase IV